MDPGRREGFSDTAAMDLAAKGQRAADFADTHCGVEPAARQLRRAFDWRGGQGNPLKGLANWWRRLG